MAMARWLFKIEPDCYGLDAFERDGETVWDGVANPAAKKHLRTAEVGDPVLYYHTGDEKAVVGVAEIAEAGQEPRVKFVRRLSNPVSLAAIKADPAFAEWELVRIPRLSVMPVPAAVWKKIESMAKKKAAG